jgi:hypothetical protein
MRHFIVPAAIAAHPFGVSKSPVATALIALTGFAHAGLARDLRAVAVAVNLAAVATAAHDDLRPAAGAHKEAACGRHRQSPSMPMRISTGLTGRAILRGHPYPVVRVWGSTPE